MSIRKVIIAGLLVVVVGTVIYWNFRPMESSSTVDVKQNVLTQAEEAILRSWRGDPKKAKTVGDICLSIDSQRNGL